MATKYTAEMMISAIKEARGNLSEAARILDCSRTTVHKYVNEYATVAAVYEEANERAVDFAEEKLMDLIGRGNITAIIFFLKTKGKHRGYVERQEVTGADGDKIIVRLAGDDEGS